MRGELRGRSAIIIIIFRYITYLVASGGKEFGEAVYHHMGEVVARDAVGVAREAHERQGVHALQNCVWLGDGERRVGFNRYTSSIKLTGYTRERLIER